ncbi:uncharacterized protein LY89DRAFT_19248 [Mollisia scopiformis]|uniref:Uncharacterized protein n=1 Tax=Mollisia scopiformis TaxID=149040 RepID=A0A194XVK4_MOLSC|nr:uncharacterized protein LY89DRAFT_19248 [Mollisia scopiformis]KUJ24355.1 hypothetical protein LY89DRAFT_19248 [Mollisia scopiformis]
MAAQEPLVHFYDLSGPKPWSPFCWLTRYALNYKNIPYTVTKVSYPGIGPKCEELFKDMTGLEATVPIIEILQPPYKALNDSTPIALLLNERFTEKDGFKHLKDIEKVDAYAESLGSFGRAIIRWIMFDVYSNSLDKSDGSQEYFKETREPRLGCELKDLLEKKGGGEEKVMQEIRENWTPLQERMKKDDGTSEPTYIDFFDAAHIRWIEAASHEKYEKLLGLYSDDTFTKLMKKVSKYET